MKTSLFKFAADLSRIQTMTYSPACDPSGIVIEILTISHDPMPGHHIARAVILDLQSSQFVKAICAVEAHIRSEYPGFVRTGWRGASDGLTIYFSAWTTNAQTQAVA